DAFVRTNPVLRPAHSASVPLPGRVSVVCRAKALRCPTRVSTGAGGARAAAARASSHVAVEPEGRDRVPRRAGRSGGAAARGRRPAGRRPARRRQPRTRLPRANARPLRRRGGGAPRRARRSARALVPMGTTLRLKPNRWCRNRELPSANPKLGGGAYLAI